MITKTRLMSNVTYVLPTNMIRMVFCFSHKLVNTSYFDMIDKTRTLIHKLIFYFRLGPSTEFYQNNIHKLHLVCFKISESLTEAPRKTYLTIKIAYSLYILNNLIVCISLYTKIGFHPSTFK